MLMRFTLALLFLSSPLLGKVLPEPTTKNPQIKYVANKGQWPLDVQYQARLGGGSTLWLRQNGYTLSLQHPEDGDWIRNHTHVGHDDKKLTHGRPEAEPLPATKKIRYEALAVNFLGGNTHRSWQEEVLPYHHNYFVGDDQSHWASDVPVSYDVYMDEVYPGIQFRMYSDGVKPKYDWILSAGADPGKIQMEFEGEVSVTLKQNRLLISTQFNEWVEETPYAYQLINGERQRVTCQFEIKDNIVSFTFPYGYDPTLPLVIDPVLVFSSYSGSLADNWGFTACFDDIGNLYSGGIVFGEGYPTSLGTYQLDFAGGEIDIGIVSFDSTGSNLRYATYIGGTNSELPQSLLVAPDSSLIILGITSSRDYPVTTNAFQSTFLGGADIVGQGVLDMNRGTDIVVNRLSFLGNDLLGATYLGGTGNDGVKTSFNNLTWFYGDDYRGDVIADENGNIFIATVTESSNFPTNGNGFQEFYGGGRSDAMIVSLSPDLSQLRWSTYLGGSSEDAAYSVKIDENGNILVAGGTQSIDFSGIRNGYHQFSLGGIDGFITLLSPDGTEVRAGTLLGTSRDDQIYFVDIDTAGQVYAWGSTFGDYPIQGAVYSNPGSGQFLHQLSPTLDSTSWSTVFGSREGGPDMSPTAFLVNECGNIYLSGWFGPLLGIGNSDANSVLPLTTDAFQNQTDGKDFYLAVLNRQASELLYGTYFGEYAPGTELGRDHVDGGTSRFDKRGIVYQSVCASCTNGVTNSNDFPTTENAFSQENNSGNCNNAVFKFDLASINAQFRTNTPDGLSPNINVGCRPFTVLFENQSEGGLEFIWDFDDGDQFVTTEGDDVEHTFTELGSYNVILTVVDANTCLVRDSAFATITVTEGNFNAGTDTTICLGDQVQLFASGAVDYVWIPPFGLNNSRIHNPIASPTQTTEYQVRMTDFAGCEFDTTINVEVIGDVGSFFTTAQTTDCIDDNTVVFQNQSINATEFTWDFGDGNISTEENPTHVFARDSIYLVTLTVENGSCTSEYEQRVEVRQFEIPTVITPNGDGYNETLRIKTTEQVGLSVFNRWGEMQYKAENYLNDWGGENLPDGVYYVLIDLPEEKFCKGLVSVLRE